MALAIAHFFGADDWGVTVVSRAAAAAAGFADVWDRHYGHTAELAHPGSHGGEWASVYDMASACAAHAGAGAIPCADWLIYLLAPAAAPDDAAAFAAALAGRHRRHAQNEAT
jgi:hypothetical protein